tara:strand:- start:12924 stop:13415 length:492 start_codon:yes stop_codon:yes gene_type:complete
VALQNRKGNQPMTQRVKRSEVLTDLILEIFRFNGTLRETGDNLVRGLGLTSARWQVLGAITMEEHNPTVASIARRMGLARQSVQRVVNDLVKEGLLICKDNPDHKRAKLIVMTEAGSEKYRLADVRQHHWVEALSDNLTAQELQQALDLIRQLDQRCRKDLSK